MLWGFIMLANHHCFQNTLCWCAGLMLCIWGCITLWTTMLHNRGPGSGRQSKLKLYFIESTGSFSKLSKRYAIISEAASPSWNNKAPSALDKDTKSVMMLCDEKECFLTRISDLPFRLKVFIIYLINRVPAKLWLDFTSQHDITNNTYKIALISFQINHFQHYF